MNNAPLELLYEQIIVEAYKEPFLSKQVERLRKQADKATVTDRMIRDLVNRFSELNVSGKNKQQIKDFVKNFIDNKTWTAKTPEEEVKLKKLLADPLDVTRYDFDELSLLVHQFRNPEEKKAIKAALSQPEQTGAELIYENPENGLQVYFGKNASQCVIFKNFLYKKGRKEMDPGKQYYNWCISYGDGRSYFGTYRFGHGRVGEGASVYFVYDETLPKTDDRHVIVIHAQENGLYRVTNAFNNREQVVDWETVTSSQWQPKLKPIKNLIKFVPHTEEELIARDVERGSAKDFGAFSYKAKKAYIELGKSIYGEDYVNLPAELQHAYINVRTPDATQIDPKNPNRGFSVALMKLVKLFEPTGPNENTFASKVERAKRIKQKLINDGIDPNLDKSWEEPFFDDPYMQQSKKNQTIKFWQKLINDILDGLGQNTGAAARAARVAGV